MGFMLNKRLHSMKLMMLAIFLLAAVFSGLALSKLDVVCTTSVLADPVAYIGGNDVAAISIADPTLCPHLQSDIIPNRIQLNKDFIKSADMFAAYNDSNDRLYNMPAVDKFMSANGYGNVTWKTISNLQSWNTPTNAKLLAGQVKSWLEDKDPTNTINYEKRYDDYVKTFDAIEIKHFF